MQTINVDLVKLVDVPQAPQLNWWSRTTQECRGIMLHTFVKMTHLSIIVFFQQISFRTPNIPGCTVPGLLNQFIWARVFQIFLRNHSEISSLCRLRIIHPHIRDQKNSQFKLLRTVSEQYARTGKIIVLYKGAPTLWRDGSSETICVNCSKLCWLSTTAREFRHYCCYRLWFPILDGRNFYFKILTSYLFTLFRIIKHPLSLQYKRDTDPRQ